jgi:hypothetical protein
MTTKTAPTCLIAVLLLMFGQACMTAPAQRGAIESMELSISNQKARLIIRTYADQIAGTIEVTAGRLAEQTNDPAIKRALLLWKLEGISEVFGASFHPDPYISFVDLAALSGQMRDFFVTGLGEEALGPLSPEAAHACEEMWMLAKVIADTVRSLSKRADRFDELDHWVKQHPIDNWQFNREPVGPHIYLILGDDAASLGQTVASIQERIDDLSAQITFINTKLLDRARWQVELLFLEAGSEFPLDSLRILLHTSTATMANLDSFLASVPDVIGSERRAALQAIGKERAIVLETLHGELELLQTFVRAERASALQSADKTAQDAVRLAMIELTGIIDMLTFRIALLCLGFGIFGAVIGAFIASRKKKSPISS